MVCYDIDTFRNFVSSEGFSGLYDLPADEAAKILADDTALRLFGFRFLRQVLFGENSIALKKAGADMRRERVQEKVAQIEREAMEQDGMYENPEI